MKQQLLEREVTRLRDYIKRLEDEIILGSRETALKIIRQGRAEKEIV